MSVEPHPESAVVTSKLGKSFGAKTALSDCTIDVPEGSICALVGPNGAGKTTLLKILAGLSNPTTGSSRVMGRTPGQDLAFLAEVGFLAQDIPLWRRLSANDHIEIGGRLNPRWDGRGARDRLRGVGVDLDRHVRTLSGGERAQVALSLALAKQPRLLLLDEPVAALDPLARRHFMSTLVEAVAGGDLTVVISSHLVGDLERICDYLVLLSASRPQLCGDITALVSRHKVLSGAHRDSATVAGVEAVIESTTTSRQTTMLVRTSGPILDPTWDVIDVGLEEVVLGYMGQSAPSDARPLQTVGGKR